ncbi:MAG: catalase HPII, partial [Chitinophagaceae bacterium]
HKIRERSESFFDHFSQPELFYKSLSSPEQRHLQDAFAFELGKVKIVPIRQRMVNVLMEVDTSLAEIVAGKLGLVPRRPHQPVTDSIPADGDPKEYHSFKAKLPISKAPSVSMEKKKPANIKAMRIAILTANGVEDEAFTVVKKILCEEEAIVHIIAPNHGFVETANGDAYPVDESLLTAASVVYDSVFVPGGSGAEELKSHAAAVHFVAEAFKHCKTIGASAEGVGLLEIALPKNKVPSPGVITNGKIDDFISAMLQYRFWEREVEDGVPA